LAGSSAGSLAALGSVGKKPFPTEPNAAKDPAADPAKQNKVALDASESVGSGFFASELVGTGFLAFESAGSGFFALD